MVDFSKIDSEGGTLAPQTIKYNGQTLNYLGTIQNRAVYAAPGQEKTQFAIASEDTSSRSYGGYVAREIVSGDPTTWNGFVASNKAPGAATGDKIPKSSGYSPPVPTSTSPTTPITSSNLSSPPPIPYQTPNPPPAYPVSTLGSTGTATPGVNSNGQMSLTPEEQKAQDFNTKLQELNNQLLGQSAYRTEQENAQGIGALNATRQDLTSQLNALKNEAMAIPLQAQNQAEGRGITTGGLRPIEAAAARNNAIQALSVNSLLEATNGNISTALQMVDRAVAQKFDPIKEQIEVAQKNLDLILNSPQASIEDKNRAIAQKAIQEAKADQLAQEQDNWKNIQKVAVDAAAAGVDALTLNKIQNAKSPVEAASLAAAAGVYSTDESKILSPSEAEKLGVPYGTTQEEAAAQNIIPKSPASNASIGPTKSEQYRNEGYKGITPDMTQAEADAAVAAQIKPAAPSGYPTTDLQPGSTNTAEVKKLQDWLVKNGYMSQSDVNTGYGTYGPKTTAAVAKVQSQYGVDNTGAVGYWGPKTKTALAGGAPKPLEKPKTPKDAPEYAFSATGSDKSKVLQFAAENSDIDDQKLKTDEGYFYWVLSQANADNEGDLF